MTELHPRPRGLFAAIIVVSALLVVSLVALSYTVGRSQRVSVAAAGTSYGTNTDAQPAAAVAASAPTTTLPAAADAPAPTAMHVAATPLPTRTDRNEEPTALSTDGDLPTDVYTGADGEGVTDSGYNNGPDGIPQTLELTDEAVATALPSGVTPDDLTAESWGSFVNCVNTTPAFAVPSDCYFLVGQD